MSSAAVLTNSKLRDPAIPSSIQIIALMPIPLQRLVNGRKTLVKTLHADDRPNGRTQN